MPHSAWVHIGGVLRPALPTYQLVADNPTLQPISVDVSARLGPGAAAVSVPPHSAIIDVPDDTLPFGGAGARGLTMIDWAGRKLVVGATPDTLAAWAAYLDIMYSQHAGAFRPRLA